jgi:hypothetical protein
VLVILASGQDKAAKALAARWAAHDATLLTCSDLSVAGWRHYVGTPEASKVALGGRVLAVEEISAVLTRWPGVHTQELVHIVPEDRAYVASEMTAFLVSWLTQLRCPVLNRPTATSLLGPGWRPEQWVYVAAHLGMPVRPVQRRVKRGDGPPTGSLYQQPPDLQHSMVTIVGDRWFGAVEPGLARQARRLADVAGVDLLAVYFSGPEQGAALLGADLWPDLTDDAVADAVLDYLAAERHEHSMSSRGKR